jgi:hypothetical protein
VSGSSWRRGNKDPKVLKVQQAAKQILARVANKARVQPCACAPAIFNALRPFIRLQKKSRGELVSSCAPSSSFSSHRTAFHNPRRC